MILPVGLLSRKSVFLLEQVENARRGGKGGREANKKGEKQSRKSGGGTKKKEGTKAGIDAPPTSAKKVTLAEPPQVWLPTKQIRFFFTSDYFIHSNKHKFRNRHDKVIDCKKLMKIT